MNSFCYTFNSGSYALIIIDEMLISDFSDFNSEARLTMVFATSSDGAFDFESFVST